MNVTVSPKLMSCLLAWKLTAEAGVTMTVIRAVLEPNRFVARISTM